ncbi:hypothetical protein ED733_008227 [Metarhizium rileyi]|uniref:Alpha/beta hydrolase fold-3 domain-containing protein n=1 Tax=Metarhizium rileyi (strain RCEF 4871) TaxID=1649241 RepID=A0A5C6GMN3_METRR|nr:hypothetical protein ED733_008227 [Metarhizium rileyi]
MIKLNTTSVSLAVIPTVISTLFSHYLHRKPLKQKPTADLSYDEGLHLIRSFIDFASHHTVEELQAFTSQWVPSPQWVKVDVISISDEFLSRSAELIQDQLGPGGIVQVGGKQWWQWRKSKTMLEGEWIEMRSHYNARKATDDDGRRVILYVHGGAYYFGSVDEHRYQMQRHARKLKARLFAPKYRLAPQFPFPCGLQDCLAAYLYLISFQEPSTIVFAGDSAGGGMIVSILCILRDQGIPLPAGGILISPWLDLTHSFPSVAADHLYDHVPRSGFHHKPSRAWPPPNEDDIARLRREAVKQANKQANKAAANDSAKSSAAATNGSKSATSTSVDEDKLADLPGNVTAPAKHLIVMMDGKAVAIKDQIQLYTTNLLLNHPLVSPVMQTTLGGLPPLLILVGGGEILRDEQIYVAHKCAHPRKYAPPLERLSERELELLEKYKPTFTRPAKFMYRSIAQFGAWALARAQKRGIEILYDDDISVISNSDAEVSQSIHNENEEKRQNEQGETGQVGKAGDPLPHFINHMIRQRVTRHGVTLPLAAETELPGCCMNASDIGIAKEDMVKRWEATKKQWDNRYSYFKMKVHKKIMKEMVIGFQDWGPNEYPPPTALAGRRLIRSEVAEGKKTKSMGLALWSFWGSKHDGLAVEREEEADKTSDTQDVSGVEDERGASSYQDVKSQQPGSSKQVIGSRHRSRRRIVIDEHQTDDTGTDNDTPVAHLIMQRKEQEAARPGLLSPSYVPETGVAGKRPFLDGIALPFSLGKDAETASMITLNSAITPAGDRSLLLSPLGSSIDVSGPQVSDNEARAENMPATRNTQPSLDSLAEADHKSRIEGPG